MKTFFTRFSLLLACLAVAACASKPVLSQKSAIVPVGVDFSGEWQLRIEPDATRRPRADGEQRIRIPPPVSRRNAGRSTLEGQSRPASRKSPGTAVQVFLETGDVLKISQTLTSLFISFDRAVVEEYTFGENRVVSIGPIEAQRVSGWQDGVFVVETLDRAGAVLIESWRLDESGTVLVRDVSVAEGEREQFSSRQHFDRI